MTQLNKKMKLYFIYMILTETLIMALEKVFVEYLLGELVAGQAVMLVVKLKVLMMEKLYQKLEVKLVPDIA